MTPKEKAKELKDKFQKQIFFDVTDERLDINEAKGLALISVYEIISELEDIINFTGNQFSLKLIKYWQEVKQEIEKL